MTSPALLTKELESAMMKLKDHARWGFSTANRMQTPEAAALLAHIAALEQRVEAIVTLAKKQRADERYYSDYTDSMRASDLRELHRAIIEDAVLPKEPR